MRNENYILDSQRFKEFEITDNARTILEKRYLKRDINTDEVIEEPRDLFIRVAKAIAGGSKLSDGNTPYDEEIEELEVKFYNMMVDKDFFPNSPTLMNAGRELPNLSACFVLPIEDSMDGIFDTIKDAALIHKSGGGTGFDFSKLRSSGSTVKTTAGTASGVVSFMSVFNAATETIKQGGVRRGANMGILRVDHPDIMEFIACKEDTSKLTNFNISIAITDEFMEAYKAGETYPIYDHKGEIHSYKQAKDVMSAIVDHAWSTGEPGLVFIDKVNRANTLPDVGDISATNPCGEQPLLPYGSCNLGSINLSNFYISSKQWGIDWDRLAETVKLSVLFLDNVIEVGQYPLEKIHEVAKSNRNIGLGVMGFADFLYKRRIAYNSLEGVEQGKKIMAFINKVATKASMELAEERGSFPNHEFSIYAYPMRNSNVTTVAPTGTVGMLAEASGGIEPNFALVYVKQVMDGEKLLYVNPILEQELKDRGIYTDELMEKIAETGRLEGIDGIPEDIKRVFVTAQEITPEYHIKMQSAFQENVDSAISKTVNFDNSATKEDILDAYLQAYESHCKGVTVYRDGCRPFQVLNSGNKTNEERNDIEVNKTLEAPRNSPRKRPDVCNGKTYKVNTGEGAMYVTINDVDGQPFEVFAQIGKAGGNAAAQSEAISRLVSLALRSEIDIDVIVKQLIGIGSPTPVWHNGEQILSTPDGIAKVLKRYISTDDEVQVAPKGGKICPKCNSNMFMSEGCVTCPSCSYSKCS